jgi:NAD(P)-dependent dehydrogenase (short-subunit alcohol dehydrogenase family)
MLTGGLGGLGLVAARELLALGERTLDLNSRNARLGSGPNVLDVLTTKASGRILACDPADGHEISDLHLHLANW